MKYDSHTIHNYLTGNLAEKDVVEFEQLLRNDEKLQQAVEEQKIITDVLHKVVFQQVKKENRLLLEKHKKETIDFVKSWFGLPKWTFGVILLLAIIFALIYWYEKKEVQIDNTTILALAEEAWKNSPELPYGMLRVSSDVNASKKLILAAYNAYIAENYEEMNSLLSGFTVQSPNYEDAILISALAHYRQQDDQKALALLEVGLQLSENTQQELMQWYKSILLLKTGNIKEACLLLQKIVSGSKRISEKAQKLLENCN